MRLSDDKTTQGQARSHLIGESIEALSDAGVPFLRALEAVLKVYTPMPDDAIRAAMQEQPCKS